jgi:hypothetical protein
MSSLMRRALCCIIKYDNRAASRRIHKPDQHHLHDQLEIFHTGIVQKYCMRGNFALGRK